MTPTLSSTGLVLHNLGLASAFGGSLFGQVALDPATQVLSSEEERGKIASAAWSRYSVVNGLGLGLCALTWAIGRTKLGGWEIDAPTRAMVIAKDILIGSSVALTAGSIATGLYLSKQAPEGAVPVRSGNEPSARTPEQARKAQRVVNAMGTANLVCMAGIIGLTALLNMKAGTSTRWAFLSRWLP